MPIKDVRGLISELERHGELKRIEAEVDADLEVAEIMRREMYCNGPAMLFENVRGHDMPILGNAFGSMRRLEIGLGMTDFTEIGKRIVDMTRMHVPSGLLGKLKKLPELSKMAAVFPKSESGGPVSEVTPARPSFDDIPILKSWPGDAGRFITLGLVATAHPETGVRNLGVFRMQVLDGTHALMHWQRHKRGAHHGEISRDRGEKIPAAVIIGGDPATVFFCHRARTGRAGQVPFCRNHQKGGH